jgi:addiction module HigA family antidote
MCSVSFHRVRTLRDLRAPPGNHLEALAGDRRGQHSIRINDQWRVCFRWTSVMAKKRLDPIPPGEILLEEFMRPLGVSINRLARDIAVPPNRISGIVNGKRSITADTALRLVRRSAGEAIEAQVRLRAA